MCLHPVPSKRMPESPLALNRWRLPHAAAYGRCSHLKITNEKSPAVQLRASLGKLLSNHVVDARRCRRKALVSARPGAAAASARSGRERPPAALQSLRRRLRSPRLALRLPP